MSITDSASNLATTWTEQDTVAFTSGTLATVTDCVTEVESKIKRGTLSSSTTPTDTQVQRWLIRAKEEISELRSYTWRRRYAYATTVAAQYRYALPPDYDGGRVMLRDTTNNRQIEILDSHFFDTRWPDPSEEDADEPEVAAIKGNELWLLPPPAGAYTLEITYDRSGDDNTPTDISWLPQLERFRICDFAVAESFASLHMWDESKYYYDKWMAGVGKSIKGDARRKWKTMRYQARSMFQEWDDRGYQP